MMLCGERDLACGRLAAKLVGNRCFSTRVYCDKCGEDWRIFSAWLKPSLALYRLNQYEPRLAMVRLPSGKIILFRPRSAQELMTRLKAVRESSYLF